MWFFLSENQNFEGLGFEICMYKPSKIDKKHNVEMRGRVRIDYSSIMVGLEGQVRRPNRAKREPKHDLAGQERPQQGKTPKQASQKKLSFVQRKMGTVVLGGEGFTLP